MDILPPGAARSGTQLLQETKRKPLCRFFGTARGCRAGCACPFRHEASSSTRPKGVLDTALTSAVVTTTERQEDGVPGLISSGTIPIITTTATQLSRSQRQSREPRQKRRGSPTAAIVSKTAATSPTPPIRPAHQVIVAPSRVVARPTAAAEVVDPRAFQISQLVKRFSGRAEDHATSCETSIYFDMPPSDPDFPFELNALTCIIRLPRGFPACLNDPTLRVLNTEVERGYQVKVEQAFEDIWRAAARPTLLNAMKSLDRQLEALLIGRKAETIKFVAPPRSKPLVDPKPVISPQPKEKQSPQSVSVAPSITSIRREAASKQRIAEIQTLTHRLGSNPIFSRSADSTIFTLPIDPRKRDALPQALQAVKSLHLFVPIGYDIDAPGIELLGVSGEAASIVETAFMQRALHKPDAPLLGQINYLAQNMHAMAITDTAETQDQRTGTNPPLASNSSHAKSGSDYDNRPPIYTSATPVIENDKPHLQIIPRPPEWCGFPPNTTGDSETDDASTSTCDTTTSDEDGSADQEEDEEDEDHVINSNDMSASTSTPRESGIMLSFPALELYNIELLELALVALTVKCERCKDTQDVSNLRSSTVSLSSDATVAPPARDIHCKKCGLSFSLAYRGDLLHANSTRAGYFDLLACTPVDLLPCAFVPTCATCSTPCVAAVSAVRGASSLAICRHCHARMSFRIDSVKFLRTGGISDKGLERAALPRRKKKVDDALLGVVAGKELPKRGRCVHYSKSLRWFRFSCCDNVYACDRCHDEKEQHPNEFANRMLCGFCSREQNYRPEDCGICHSRLMGSKGRGFWEGGKGTRDPKRMSRKDPRKYKRRGAGAVANKKKEDGK